MHRLAPGAGAGQVHQVEDGVSFLAIEMAIDEARQHCGMAKVDHVGVRRRHETVLNSGDSSVMDQNRDIEAGRL